MFFFTGFGVSSLMYYCLNVALPPPGRFKHFKEVDLSDGESPCGGNERMGADPNEKIKRNLSGSDRPLSTSKRLNEGLV